MRRKVEAGRQGANRDGLAQSFHARTSTEANRQMRIARSASFFRKDCRYTAAMDLASQFQESILDDLVFEYNVTVGAG
jgi:hypothetical protein